MNNSKNKQKYFKFLYLIIAVLVIVGCEKTKDASDDAKQLAALRNVEFSYDSLSVNIGVPEGAIGSGKSFQQLLEENHELYSNPANYGMEIIAYLQANNTKSDADDARFDGMVNNLIMNNIHSNPIEMEADAFEIKKDKKETVDINSYINLESHRLPGLYIFQQTVAGDDLDTKMIVELFYNISHVDGSINLPEIQQHIPTRASDDLKNFLGEVIDSGIFHEK